MYTLYSILKIESYTISAKKIMSYFQVFRVGEFEKLLATPQKSPEFQGKKSP
jgi:hypothetical protein